LHIGVKSSSNTILLFSTEVIDKRKVEESKMEIILIRENKIYQGVHKAFIANENNN